MTIFQHNDFVLEIPQKWGDYSVVTMVEPPPDNDKQGFQHSLVITRDTLGEKERFREYVDVQVGNIQANFQNLSIESLNESPLKDTEGYRVIYTWQHPDTDQMFTQMQQYLRKDTRVIVITATALQSTFEEYRQIFEKTMESFQFIG